MNGEIEWPREIWMAERDDHDQGIVSAVLSEHATVARFEGDTERERDFHRYVDADIYETAERYWKARVVAAYEAAAVEMDLGAHVVSNCGIDEETQAYTNAARIIRALTPADAKAALEDVRREARNEALREAAQELSDCGEHQAVPCILALIDKETTE